MKRKLLLSVMAAATAVVTFCGGLRPADAQQAQKPNILFIMGDDIGWMQPSIYHRGLMVGETPNIDKIGNDGALFTDYYAEQSCTAGRNAFFTGMHPLRTGMIPPQLPGSPTYLKPGTPALAKFLLDLGYNTGEFGKNHLGDHTDALPTAHGFQEFWGYLYHLDAMQGVSFPDINKTPTQQTVAPPCRNTPVPGLAEVPGAVDPKTTICHYYAEQSCTAGRNAFFTGMHPLRTGMIPPQLPGSPSYLKPGTPALAKFLIDLGYNTGEFGKNHLGDHTDALPTAHGFQEFWGYLYHLDAMQGVSFPDINKTPTQQTVAPPCRNTPIPGLAEVPGAVDPKTTICLMPPRPVLACNHPTAARRTRPARTRAR